MQVQNTTEPDTSLTYYNTATDINKTAKVLIEGRKAECGSISIYCNVYSDSTREARTMAGRPAIYLMF